METETAKATDRAIGNLITSIIESLGKSAKAQLEKFRFDVERGFSQYAHVTYDRCSSIKTLIHRNQPIPLRDGYVESDFEIDNVEINESSFLNKFYNGGKLIITGNAGSGKSVFMKSCYLKSIENGGYGFPIFIELRHLKGEYKLDRRLYGFIFEKISNIAGDLTFNQFDHGMKKGAFPLILDGFDEIPIAIRDDISKDIHDLYEKYPKNAILVTSRPDSRFASWEGFSVAELLPMTKNKVIELISKTEFDISKKENFLKSINDNFYQNQKSFLSNPLLTLMMLLTYDLFGEIPKKKHIFYEKSFEVLCREHDSMKSEFSRELHSGLDIEQTKLLFKVFCMLTYIDQRYEFSHSDLIEYINSSMSISDIEEDADPAKIMKDFLESISIMQRDGSVISFVHRSFQEYFFARYAIETHDIDIKYLLAEVLSFSETDDVFLMMHDMNPKHLECDFFLPSLMQINGLFEKWNVEKQPSQILKPFFSHIIIRRVENSDESSEKYITSYRIKRQRIRHLKSTKLACD